MDTGLPGSNEVLVGLVVVGVLASLVVSTVTRQEWFGGLLLPGTGIVSLLQTGLRLVVTAGTDGMTRDAFFVGPGVYATLGGGVLLVCAGAVLQCTADRTAFGGEHHDADVATERSSTDSP